MILLEPRVTVAQRAAVSCLRSSRRRVGIADWARDILRGFVDVEVLVDRLRNRLDFSPEFLLDLVEVEAIVPID